MSRVQERYSGAIQSSNLASEERTVQSDSDFLGAMGFAGKSKPVGVALLRLFADGKSGPVVDLLAGLAFGRARLLKIKLDMFDARKVAQSTLGWYQGGRCPHCCGTGFALIRDHEQVRGMDECQHCGGVGKIPFAEQFPVEQREIALWLGSQIERETTWAGAEAMRKLAPKLEI